MSTANTSPVDAAPRADTQALQDYYTHARLLADNWLHLLSIVGVGPHAAAIAASHVISEAIVHLNRTDPEAARDLIDELAAGLLKYSETLGKQNA